LLLRLRLFVALSALCLRAFLPAMIVVQLEILTVSSFSIIVDLLKTEHKQEKKIIDNKNEKRTLNVKKKLGYLFVWYVVFS
jgi:hypothetical protein